MRRPRRRLVITGPTGTGKTAYVDRLLEAFPFEVINMDSCQVYAFFRVGTGRGDGKNGQVRHLYGFLGPHEQLSVESYLEKACALAEEIELHGGLPLFEGGSRSLLPALAEAMPLKIVGLRPPPIEGWIEAKMARRVEGFFEGDAILNEVKEALRLGYGDTKLMQDPMIYQETLAFLAGRLSLEEAKDSMVASMRAMHEQQLRFFESMDIEWFEVSEGSVEALLAHVGRWLEEERG